MMRRREFMTLLGGAAAAWPRWAEAQRLESRLQSTDAARFSVPVQNAVGGDGRARVIIGRSRSRKRVPFEFDVHVLLTFLPKHLIRVERPEPQ
jgi:hypothetical protein